MMFDFEYFDRGIDRLNTMCRKWEDRSMVKEGGLPFWVADMDFPCAPPITEALTRRAEHGLFGYSFGFENDAVIPYMQRRHSVKLESKDLCIVPSIVSGLKLAVNILSEKGDRVGLFSPVYGPFYQAINENERSLVEIPLLKDEKNRYSIDFELLELELKRGLKLILLCSPHNPVSRLWSEDELKTLLELTRKYSCAIASDEIHADFAFSGEFISIQRLIDEDDSVLSLYAGNKSFNIAGLKQGYVFCKNASIMNKLKAFISAKGIEAQNLFALLANQAAFEKCDDWLDGLLAYLRQNKLILINEFSQKMPEIKISPIDATFLAWLDIGDIDEESAMSALYEAGIALSKGSNFGRCDGKHLRFNFGCPQKQMLKGIEILINTLKNI